MNRTIEDKVAVMLAYANGKAIEWKTKTSPDGYNKWIYDFEPSWDWSNLDYRVCAEEQVKFRLPTKEEFEDLISNFSRWNAEKKGLEILNTNSDILFLPAKDDHFDILNYLVGSHGDCWGSDVNKSDQCGTYGLYFDSRSKQTNRYSCDYGCNVRLVSDVPFEGGIKFGNIYWKPENEKGYYPREDATSMFNKVIKIIKELYIL